MGLITRPLGPFFFSLSFLFLKVVGFTLSCPSFVILSGTAGHFQKLLGYGRQSSSVVCCHHYYTCLSMDFFFLAMLCSCVHCEKFWGRWLVNGLVNGKFYSSFLPSNIFKFRFLITLGINYLSLQTTSSKNTNVFKAHFFYVLCICFNKLAFWNGKTCIRSRRRQYASRDSGKGNLSMLIHKKC